MTIRETAILMDEIRIFYSIFGNNAHDHAKMVMLWHECIREISFEEGHAALITYVRGERAIYPPAPGTLLEIAREKRLMEKAERNSEEGDKDHVNHA